MARSQKIAVRTTADVLTPLHATIPPYEPLLCVMMDSDDHRNKMATKPKHPPSRALTAYNFYFHDQRRQIQEHLFQLNGQRPTYTQISRLVGSSWKKISREERAHYEALAMKDKRRYALELVEYKAKQEGSGVLHQAPHKKLAPKVSNHSTKKSAAPSPPVALRCHSDIPPTKINGVNVNPFSPSLQAMLRQSAGEKGPSAMPSLPAFPITSPEMGAQLHLLSVMMIDYVKRVAPEKLDKGADTEDYSIPAIFPEMD